MPDQKIIDWIKSEEAKGYTEAQLKQALLKQGHTQQDVDDAIKATKGDSAKSFHDSVSENGPLFTALFYIIVGMFSLSVISGIIISLITLNFLALPLPLLFLFILYRALKKKKIYKALIIAFLPTPLIILTFPLIQSFITVNDIVIYSVISVFFFVYGLLASYMFNKACDNFNKLVYSCVSLSSVLGIVFAVNNMLSTIIKTTKDIMIKAARESARGGGGMLNMFASDIANANISFILAILFFNIPFFYYYSKAKDKNLIILLLYLIPIIIFIGLALLLNFIINNTIFARMTLAA
ncbi:hypothetical protein ACFL0W_01075 [Nanoarchaeota archaeon]